MVLSVYFDGYRESVSSKGTKYADLFVRGMNAEGESDMEQLRLRTFDEGVIGVAKTLKRDAVVNLNIVIRDALVEGVAG